jgi:hypothetical protein
VPDFGARHGGRLISIVVTSRIERHGSAAQIAFVLAFELSIHDYFTYFKNLRQLRGVKQSATNPIDPTEILRSPPFLTRILKMKNAFDPVLTSLFVLTTALNWSAFGGSANASFTVSVPAARVVFDPFRPYAYLSDSGDQALVVVNLTNGLVERQFALDWPPESITISPDGQSMCVALLTQPHSAYSFGPYTNYIAEFDLSAQAKTNEIQIPIDPGDLALTDKGILVAAGGSGQWIAAGNGEPSLHVGQAGAAAGAKRGLSGHEGVRTRGHLPL